MNFLSPPIKYAGGKTWLIPRMQELYAAHRHRRFVDPFCGSCALPLALKPDQVLVCDISIHLINFWNWVKENAVFTIAMLNDEMMYYKYRSLFNETDDLNTKAELFYFLNRSCYNGLVRFSRKGNFNTPFGRYKKINYMDNLLEYKKAISSWEIKQQGFIETMSKLVPDDFLYLDPPYHKTFANYAPGGFNSKDQFSLAEYAAAHPGPVVASNAATPEIVEIYQHFEFGIRFVEVRRRISCKGSDRAPALEMLATRNI